MKNTNSNYDEALKRVQEIKNWYTSLFMFIVVNSCYLLFYFGVFDHGYISSWIPWWSPILMITIWGGSLVIQYFYIHNGSFIVTYFKNWEKRKIKEFLDQEMHSKADSSRWE